MNAWFSSSDFVKACDDAWFNGDVPHEDRNPPFSVDDPEVRKLIDVALVEDYDAVLNRIADAPDPLEDLKDEYREQTFGLMLLVALHHQLRPRKDPASVALRDRLEAAGENVLQGWRLLGRFLRALGVDTNQLLADFWPDEAA